MQKRLAWSLLLLALLSSCGTSVYEHKIAVSVFDPAHKLGSPVTVSIFDHSMGFSRDWARKTEGVASPGNPYRTTLSSQRVTTILDSSLPPQLPITIAIPQFEKDGYFMADLEPAAQEKTVEATFAPWDEYFPGGKQTRLPLRYSAKPGPKGWDLTITAVIP